MTFVVWMWALVGCGGTPGPVETTDGEIRAPDAEWMVTARTTMPGQPARVWTAWRTADGVEAAAGKGAVTVSGDEVEALEGAVQAFLSDEERAGADTDAGELSWTVVVEQGGSRVEHRGLALQGPTEDLVNAMAEATGEHGAGVLRLPQ